jgi:hypothetical protein
MWNYKEFVKLIRSLVLDQLEVVLLKNALRGKLQLPNKSVDIYVLS